MRVVIDENIPYLKDALEQVATVIPMKPEEITPTAVHNADALFVRTRTKINHDLLEGSSVQFIATATIGYDHIDTQYCEKAGIQWVSCPGCNAQAVCDYVEEVLNHFEAKGTLGVIGVGHIGSLVAKMAAGKGMKVLLNDPPKGIGVTIDEIERNCDFITFHTPLTYSPDPNRTYHLCDTDFLTHCKSEAVIINAARGGIVDEYALLKSGHRCAIDCWENEPDVNKELLLSPRTILASYHIAGYSLEGKLNASQMCLDAFCKHFGLPALVIEKKLLLLQAETKGDSKKGWLKRISDTLKANPNSFEQLRKQYKLR